MSLPFSDWTYLQRGSAAQRLAGQVLARLQVLPLLHAYSPRLVGAFPLDLQQLGSDLDLICEVHELDPFEKLLAHYFGHFPTFGQRRRRQQGWECSINCFEAEGLPVEVFGQPVPTGQQQGYRHLLVEHRLLQLGGPAFRAQVQIHRAAGLKTEPAFAAALGWTAADPYAELLTLEHCPDDELREVLASRPAGGCGQQEGWIPVGH
jgi:hypothetical protein